MPVKAGDGSTSSIENQPIDCRHALADALATNLPSRRRLPGNRHLALAGGAGGAAAGRDGLRARLAVCWACRPCDRQRLRSRPVSTRVAGTGRRASRGTRLPPTGRGPPVGRFGDGGHDRLAAAGAVAAGRLDRPGRPPSGGPSWPTRLSTPAATTSSLCFSGRLGLSLHFYHPLLHWLMSRLRLEQELAADAAAASVSGGQRQYLLTIAELALRRQDRPLFWPARTFLPTRTTFLRRIAMLRDSKVRFDRLSPLRV